MRACVFIAPLAISYANSGSGVARRSAKDRHHPRTSSARSKNIQEGGASGLLEITLCRDVWSCSS